MDIATASPLVILEVVISLFSGVGIIEFLEYNAVIFLKLPDVKFGINPVAAFRAGYPGATAPAGAISFLKNNFSNNMAADSNSNLLL
mgnify:CR=1 FL=1